MENKRRKKNKPLGLRFYLLLWLFTIAVFSIASLRQYRQYLKNVAMREAVSLELEAQKRRTAELEADLRYYESDSYIEKIAREKLGLVYDDEKLFYNSEGAETEN